VPAVALATAVLLAGCGNAVSLATVLSSTGTASPVSSTPPAASTATPPTGTASPDLSDSGLVDDAYRGRYRAVGTVLEAAGKGPQLCLGAIAASLPPQCSGPDVVGWSWQTVRHDEQGGTRWGSFVVVGQYDGTSFTLTEPATVPGAHDTQPVDQPRLDTPCPTPAGGWHPPDPATATEPAFETASQLAGRQPGFGALWIDQQGALDDGSTAGATAVANDPTHFVLNITTTGDVPAMERVLRTVWGGSLCITRARRTSAELARTRTALIGTPGMIYVSSDDRAGEVLLTVLRATNGLRRDLDHRFGAGAVRLTAALHPID